MARVEWNYMVLKNPFQYKSFYNWNTCKQFRKILASMLFKVFLWEGCVSCQEELICLRTGWPYRGIWTGLVAGLRPMEWSSTRPSTGSCTLSTTRLEAWGRVAGRLCRGNGLGVIGWCLAKYTQAVLYSKKRGRYQSTGLPSERHCTHSTSTVFQDEALVGRMERCILTIRH